MTFFRNRFFFHFDNSEPNISSGSGEKVDFSGLPSFSNSGYFDSRPA